ncbi:hypothetical protein [Cupriavidus sp. CuC1]|uniref:hypothetical protein n=1 Tax=Cupriavidus sp. CuC1 TaxID=3373131 RepID=UPI0037CCE6FC
MNAIIILGMHRSGTSALAGVLDLMGVDAGDNLLPPVKGDNPKGYWENSAIVACHDALLARIGSTWQDDRPLPENWWKAEEVEPFRVQLMDLVRHYYGAKPLWLLKDPRLCRLLPLWMDILVELEISPHFILCLRHPREVAASLAAREAVPEELSCMSWLAHVLEAERWSGHSPRTVVTYDLLLNDWQAIVRNIAETFNLSLCWDKQAEVNAFLEPTLRHHYASQDISASHESVRLAVDAYEAIEADQFENIPAIRNRFDLLSKLISPWSFGGGSNGKSMNEKSIVQLFVDSGSGFSESESIIHIVDATLPECNPIFELDSRRGVKALRLDPLDDSVILIINDACLISESGESRPLGEQRTNASVVAGDKYFFETCDPQIYFENINPDVLADSIQFSIRIRFLKTGREAQAESIHQLYADNTQRIRVLEVEANEARKTVEEERKFWGAEHGKALALLSEAHASEISALVAKDEALKASHDQLIHLLLDERAQALQEGGVREARLREEIEEERNLLGAEHEKALALLIEAHASEVSALAAKDEALKASHDQLIHQLLDERAQALREGSLREARLKEDHERALHSLRQEQADTRRLADERETRLEATYTQLLGVLRSEHSTALGEAKGREDRMREEYERGVMTLRGEYNSALDVIESGARRLAAEYEKMIALSRDEHLAAINVMSAREESANQANRETLALLRAEHFTQLQDCFQKINELERALQVISNWRGYGFLSWLNRPKKIGI